MPSRPTPKEANRNASRRALAALAPAVVGASRKTYDRYLAGDPMCSTAKTAAFDAFHSAHDGADLLAILGVALQTLATLQSQASKSETVGFDDLLAVVGPATKAAARQAQETHGQDGARAVLDFAAGAVSMLTKSNNAVGDLTVRQLTKAENDGAAFEDLVPDISIQMAQYVSAGLTKIRNPKSATTKAAPPRMRPALRAVPGPDGLRGFAAAATRKGARPSDAIDDFAQLVADGDGCVSDERLATLKISDFSAYMKARDARDERDKKTNGGLE